MDYQERLLRSIPGGAHTYSRGYDQFPSNAPQILSAGKGSHVWCDQGKQYLDYGMGLRAVNIGYAQDEIDNAAFRQIKNGNNLTRPSLVELESAEMMIELIDSVDMVKFTKNGSAAVSAAVKIARAYTGKEMVLCCEDHPFFSYDDWFIGSTQLTLGIPKDVSSKVRKFKFNDIKSIEEILSNNPNNFACLVMEAATTEEPSPGYLKQIENLCNKNRIIFILDEMITGFRWHIKGAQHYYGINPDLSTFGKAMANGFSVACVGGRRELMQLGSIDRVGMERLFLLSSTHGAEMCSLGAFLETVNYLQSHPVIDSLWAYGRKLKACFNEESKNYGIESHFNMAGIDCSPWYAALDEGKNLSPDFKTLFMQEMIKGGVLIPWVALSYSHKESELQQTRLAIQKAFKVYRDALHDGVSKYLVGSTVKPVFRKYN
jgi:glutamate-1-semialdehyde 2,1-aminomutase